jgi:hypothetical protein
MEHKPSGFINLLKDPKIHSRVCIIDDSGSMNTADGAYMFIQDKIATKVNNCTRWEELKDTVLFFLEMSHTLEIPTEFRLLNQLVRKITGDKEIDPDNCNYRTLKKFMTDESPDGLTPLCKHLGEIVTYITTLKDELLHNGKLVSLIICTDGNASDGNITPLMEQLAHLPCTVTIRLCTNSESVTEYWSNIDKDLEINLDIIDDFFGEAKEVYSKNPWINYGLFLHRIREFGINVKVFDLLDEKTLSVEHMLEFMSILFSCDKDQIPNPHINWIVFENWVSEQNKKLSHTFNPNTKELKSEPWINIDQLRQCYNIDQLRQCYNNESFESCCTIC